MMGRKTSKEKYIAVFLRGAKDSTSFFFPDAPAFLLRKLYIEIKYSSLIPEMISKILLQFRSELNVKCDNSPFAIK